jgi:hypothetical protein
MLSEPPFNRPIVILYRAVGCQELRLAEDSTTSSVISPGVSK